MTELSCSLLWPTNPVGEYPRPGKKLCIEWRKTNKDLDNKAGVQVVNNICAMDYTDVLSCRPRKAVSVEITQRLDARVERVEP